VKKLPLFTPRQALFYHRRPSTHKTMTAAPGFPRARPYPFLVDSLSNVSIWPRPPSVNKGMTPARQLQGISRSTQGPGSFTVPSSSPRHPGDGRPFLEHAATATSTAPIKLSPLRHRLRVLGAPKPSLDTIKERAEGSPGDREKRIDTFLHFRDQHLKQHSILLFS
jgi:hypothetical protein